MSCSSLTEKKQHGSIRVQQSSSVKAYSRRPPFLQIRRSQKAKIGNKQKQTSVSSPIFRQNDFNFRQDTLISLRWHCINNEKIKLLVPYQLIRNIKRYCRIPQTLDQPITDNIVESIHKALIIKDETRWWHVELLGWETNVRLWTFFLF